MDPDDVSLLAVRMENLTEAIDVLIQELRQCRL
jgi:hypothetical protein